MEATVAQPKPEDDMSLVVRWRFQQLSRAGFQPQEAVVLASDANVDLHRALELLRRGCPPETAFRILL